MRIEPDALVAGFPAREIRKLLRQSDQFLSSQDATKILGLHEKKAVQVLERLEREGFIERNTSVPDSKAVHYWKRSIKGSALCKALFSMPVSRRTAEKKLNEFMNRVHQVNADSRFLYRVRRVILFGSFLTDTPSVGDLDLAIDLDRKEPDAEKHSSMVLARAEEAARNGRRFSSFVERIYFAELEVSLFLKARSRIIQLTDAGDGVLKISKCRVIYENLEENPPTRR
jgi:DNA-binding Lrp family transcriptional regulator